MQFEHIDVPRLLSLLFIKATQRGKAWTALCPSGRHVDAHPSWSIRFDPGSRKNGKMHCFSCGWGGTAVDLVTHVLELSPGGAVDFIAERALLEVHPAVSIQLDIGSTSVRESCVLPPGVYFDALEDWITQPQKYVRGRRITDEQIARWRIGYAVDGRLQGRFVIPTYDRQGTLLNWTARTYTDDRVRYLSASTTDHPEIDAVFGEEFWAEGRQDSPVIVTEGALNALAVERAATYPFQLAALSGSHLEPGHALKLSRFKQVLILTDPDMAGDKVAAQLVGMLGRHATVSRLRLPVGTDPDSISVGDLRAQLSESLRSLALTAVKTR
jgi:DNA primase